MAGLVWGQISLGTCRVARYRLFADSMSLVVQYRALSVDYYDGTRGASERFCYDTITYGPAVGLDFSL